MAVVVMAFSSKKVKKVFSFFGEKLITPATIY
jgi:hypothetical protein